MNDVSALPAEWDYREVHGEDAWAGGVSTFSPDNFVLRCTPYTQFALTHFAPLDLTPQESQLVLQLSSRPESTDVWGDAARAALDTADFQGLAIVPARHLFAAVQPQLQEALNAQIVRDLRGLNTKLRALTFGCMPRVAAVLTRLDVHTLRQLVVQLRGRIRNVDAELRSNSKRMYDEGCTEREVMVESILKGVFPLDLAVAHACECTRDSNGIALPEWTPQIRFASALIVLSGIFRAAPHLQGAVDKTATIKLDLPKVATRLADQPYGKTARMLEALLATGLFPGTQRLAEASATWHALAHIAYPEREPSRYDEAKALAARKIALVERVKGQISATQSAIGSVAAARTCTARAVVLVLTQQIDATKRRLKALRPQVPSKPPQVEADRIWAQNIIALRVQRAERRALGAAASAPESNDDDDDHLSVFSTDTEVASVNDD